LDPGRDDAAILRLFAGIYRAAAAAVGSFNTHELPGGWGSSTRIGSNSQGSDRERGRCLPDSLAMARDDRKVVSMAETLKARLPDAQR
jgi:hypothetical protein